MAILETMAIIAAVRAVQAFIKSVNSKPALSAASAPLAARPEKVITFVGATNSGKSSTINALLGYAAFPVGQKHGTTQVVEERSFVNGYRLRDTPGILDTVDYSYLIGEAVKTSDLVIFTATEELYRQELEMLQQIYQKQQQWDIEAASYGQRMLALYVNKRDIKNLLLTAEEYEQEIAAIHKQVSYRVPANRIVLGSAAPISRRGKTSPDISSLKSLISSHISSRTGG
ncbi:MAG: GTPase domain-containing protein [Blastocatellia bacterium]